MKIRTLLLFLGLQIAMTASAGMIDLGNGVTATTDNAGQLVSAWGIDIFDDGTLYDASFVDGTCESVFGTCAQANFNFTNASDAEAAAQSLLDHVFLGIFDTSPDLTATITLSDFGIFMVPFEINSFNNPETIVAVNNSGVIDGAPFQLSFDATTDTTPLSNFSYVQFTESQSVPEPSTLALLGLGIAALGFRRKISI